MGSNLAFHTLVYFLSISIQNQDAVATSTNQTYHHCNCPAQTPSCGNVNISCASDISIQWVGLRDFAFGLLPNGTNCSAEATSSFVIPSTGDNHTSCLQDFNTMLHILGGLSGRVISKMFLPMDVYCNQETAYFVANYDCVIHNFDNDLILDSSCNYNKTLNALPISSISYPNKVINSTGVRSCQCLLKTTAKELVLRTYDNRLATNQTLTLSYGNHSVIKQWSNTTVIEEVINTVHVIESFSNTQLLLNWENNAEKDTGMIWVVLEAVGGNITAICKQNLSTTLSPPTATTPQNTATVNDSSSTFSSIGNRQDSSSIPPNAFNDSSSASQNSTTVTVSTPMTLNSADSSTLSATSKTLNASSPSLPNSTVLSAAYSGNMTSSLPSRVGVTSYPSSQMNTANTDATPHGNAQSEKPSDGKGNIAAIIGGVLGGLAALIALILCCCLLCLKKNRKTEPETNKQPANSKFKNENNTQGKPGRNEQDNKLGLDSSEVAVAASISAYTFPPLPTGRLVNTVQNKTSPGESDTSRNDHIPFGANSKQEKGNIRENGKLNDALYAQLTGDLLDENKFTNDDMVALTEPALSSVGNTRGALMIESQENDVTDDNGQDKKKKKKKRKKKRKWNQIGTLLDEDVNAESKLQDTEQFPPYDV